MENTSHSSAARHRRSSSRPQAGAVAVMFICSLIVIFGFFGLALDLSMLYNRKIEMQNVADTVALAAAVDLNGTPAGVAAALKNASERLMIAPGSLSGSVLSYQYSQRAMQWSDKAIEFGRTPDGPWVSADAAHDKPEGLLFARVDTRNLNAVYGEVETLFIRVLAPALKATSTAASAVAGRADIRVTPLGICAMRPEAARSHNGELEEYGFRRGGAYDLMQLKADSSTANQTYLINPMVPPGSVGAVPATDAASAAAFVCTGTMAMARVSGGALHVTSPFPLGDLYRQLNSRFDTYAAPCSAASAPPDANIKEYIFDNGSVPWMSVAPGRQSAKRLDDGKLWTILGPDTPLAGITGTDYGLLWSYAKAARFSAYASGVPEPSAGYSTFAITDWSTLYSTVPITAVPKAVSYPSTTPYAQSSGQYFKAPVRKGVRERRVLNVALLNCPVTGNSATLLGIGKFFMPVPAGAATLIGEFAGLAQEQSLGSNLKLYQ